MAKQVLSLHQAMVSDGICDYIYLQSQKTKTNNNKNCIMIYIECPTNDSDGWCSVEGHICELRVSTNVLYLRMKYNWMFP